MAHRFVAVVTILLLAAVSAEAALTTPKCLVAKRKAWATRRKCEASEEVKRLQQKPVDLVKCAQKHEGSLAKIDVKAAKAIVACRHGVNFDGTLTDYDTGLMWELKTDDPFLCVAGVVRCVDKQFTWVEALSTFIATLNGGTGFAGHTDWRVPTFGELFAIFDCSSGSLTCLDTAFGPVGPLHFYFSSTLDGPNAARGVDFTSDQGGASLTNVLSSFHVRAVRNAL